MCHSCNARAATGEKGWENAGIAYCNYGFCNRTAGDQYGAPSMYLPGPNPLDGVDTTSVEHDH